MLNALYKLKLGNMACNWEAQGVGAAVLQTLCCLLLQFSSNVFLSIYGSLPEKRHRRRRLQGHDCWYCGLLHDSLYRRYLSLDITRWQYFGVMLSSGHCCAVTCQECAKYGCKDLHVKYWLKGGKFFHHISSTAWLQHGCICRRVLMEKSSLAKANNTLLNTGRLLSLFSGILSVAEDPCRVVFENNFNSTHNSSEIVNCCLNLFNR